MVTGTTVLIGEPQNELVRLGLSCGLDNLLAGRAGSAISDVLEGRAIEHCRLLGNHADLTPQAFLRHIPKVVTVQQDSAALRIVQAHQKCGEGRLSRAGFADKSDMFARLDD